MDEKFSPPRTCPVIWIIGQIVNARFPDVRAQYSDASKRM
ncbi:hypothetical protein SXCC_00285 [Gluconacetobacter sp. SXCC-1]|nr:hypothetical protein SXCC_00299 [Gluconacetobacter sp. SXCC-1]EGG79042.1 hypothetical protein SXCC_00285 [Gluconacetobacter sp. SXCC-1]